MYYKTIILSIVFTRFAGKFCENSLRVVPLGILYAKANLPGICQLSACALASVVYEAAGFKYLHQGIVLRFAEWSGREIVAAEGSVMAVTLASAGLIDKIV